MTMTDQPAPDAAEETPPDQAPVDVADRPDVEVVDRSVLEERTGGDLARVEQTALERATEEALNNPAVPGRDEFLMLATTARILCMSAGAPAAVRNNPWLAFHLALIGRDLGISPSAALQQIDVIGWDASKPNDYDKVQLALSPELLNGQIKRLGLGRIVPAAQSAETCTAVAVGTGGQVDHRCKATYPEHVDACDCRAIIGDYTFTWDEAMQAGLVDPRCEPFDHWVNPETRAGQEWKNENRCRCRQGYRTYPKRMLWWRAAGYCSADYFPEASIGMYSPEELGAVVDAEGRPIDPGSVEVPDGYGPPPPPPPSPAEDVVATSEDPGLVALREDLAGRIAAVKEAGAEAVAALRALWEEADAEGARKTPPWLHDGFRRRHMTRARAVVASVEDRIKRGEWGEDVKAAWADATTTGAGFGRGAGQAEKAPGEDGKTPHQLARERAARERGTPEAPEGAQDTPTEAESDAGDDDGEPTGDAPAALCDACGVREGGEHDQRMHELADAVDAARATTGQVAAEEEAPPAAEPDRDDLERPDCLGCGKPMKSTQDGRNHPGPNGRAGAPHRSFHRSCAPFD